MKEEYVLSLIEGLEENIIKFIKEEPQILREGDFVGVNNHGFNTAIGYCLLEIKRFKQRIKK